MTLTGQGMQIDDDVHVICANSVVRNLPQVFELVATIQLGSGNINPCSVSSGDSNSIDVDSCELVDSRVGNEVRIVVLEKRTTSLLPDSLTKGPFIGNICAAVDPDIRSNGSLDYQPAACSRHTMVNTDGELRKSCAVRQLTQVCAVSLEGIPSFELGKVLRCNPMVMLVMLEVVAAMIAVFIKMAVVVEVARRNCR